MFQVNKVRKWQQRTNDGAILEERPFPAAKQYRAQAAVRKHPKSFMRCGHFACDEAPPDMKWEEGEEPTTCVMIHLANCPMKEADNNQLRFYQEFFNGVRKTKIEERETKAKARAMVSTI